MLQPDAAKIPPRFSATQLAVLCGLDRSQLNYRLGKGDLPSGTSTGSRRSFTLTEARQWILAHGGAQRRPSGAKAVTVAVGNFKGGVTKTTTAMSLAQGLSLRGHRILVIDTDPQGSLTTLFGISPQTEVDDEETVLPLCEGTETSIRYAVVETYWDGIDLVPAAPSLFNAEFELPSRQLRQKGFEFWNVLNAGLDDVRSEYDVIIIDTPPALSYLTINAFMAAEGMLVPLPPYALDFASSAQFWSLFSDLASKLSGARERAGAPQKSFDFIHVLLAKVKRSDTASSLVREWITAAYSDKVLPVEIPDTAVASASSVEFGTAYDISHYAGHYKTYERAREAYDRVTELVEQSIAASWNRQLSEGA